jgi:ribosomal protein S18 acetylase RimI-like enzyme
MSKDDPAGGAGGGAAAADPTAWAERDYLTYASSFGRVPGVTTIRRPELLARRGDPAHDYLNLVLGTWATEDTVDAVIDRTLAEVGGPGRPFTWSVWPSNEPAGLRERLVAHGFAHLGDGPLMWLDLTTAELPDEAPPGLTIERVTDRATLREAGDAAMPAAGGDEEARRLFREAYEALILGPDPLMTYFAGRMDGRIVSTSAVYTGTGLAGIYAIATVPDARGRGHGRALTAAALVEGRRRGFEHAALLSSELGLPVYRRLGFREVGTVSFFASPPDDVSPA